MGTSKSQEFTSLFQHFSPNQWKVLSQNPSHQIWQRQSDQRSFMAFPLSQSDIDSEEKLQLYNFRKLNHGSLVAVQSILRADASNLCAPPQSSYLLIENIPVRISNYNGSLSFHEALITLNAAFAGYNTLNFLYGPLYTDEEMIGFTQSGVPKVWVNAVLALNQPSRAALEAESECYQGSIEHRTYNCVQRILEVVQKATNGGFPREFKSETTSIGSFAEGEEFVENYARKAGIIIDDRIAQPKRPKIQPLKFKSQNYLFSQRHSVKTQNIAPTTIDNTNQSNFVEQWRSTMGNNTYRVSQPFIQHIPLRSSLNNPRINIVYVKQLQQSNQTQITKPNEVYAAKQIKVSNQNNVFPREQEKKIEDVVILPQVTLPFRQISESIQPELLSSHSPTETFPARPQICAVQSKQEIIFHNMFVSTQTQNNDFHQQNHQPIEEKFDPSRIQESEQYKQEQIEIPHQLIQIQENVLQNVHQIQKEQEKQIVNQINQQIFVDNRRVATSQSVEDKNLVQSVQGEDKQDQIYKWEQSLLKLSNKQKESKNSSANPSRSNSVNPLPLTLPLRETQEPSLIHSLTHQSEFESYIRNKYRQYLQQQTNEQKPYSYQQYSYEQKQPSYETKPRKQKSQQYEYQTSNYFDRNYQVQMEPIEQQTSPQVKQTRQDHLVQADQRKYTFGKIQLDPISANHQYIRARQKEQKKRESLQINFEQLNTSIGKSSFAKSSLEDRYSKYVKNRKVRPASYGRDLSAIMRGSQSKVRQENNHSFVQEPNSMLREVRPRPQPRNLTYDKLRELLWA